MNRDQRSALSAQRPLAITSLETAQPVLETLSRDYLLAVAAQTCSIATAVNFCVVTSRRTALSAVYGTDTATVTPIDELLRCRQQALSAQFTATALTARTATWATAAAAARASRAASRSAVESGEQAALHGIELRTVSGGNLVRRELSSTVNKQSKAQRVRRSEGRW